MMSGKQEQGQEGRYWMNGRCQNQSQRWHVIVYYLYICLILKLVFIICV